jgi:hypothetical protein
MTAVLGVTPILNVSDIRVSIEWFEQMGWRELWVWRDDDAAPTDEPWGVREFHLRHPDGHTFQVSSGLN